MFVTGINASGFPATGITAGPGSGTWASHSDRNIKENFAAIDPRSILEKVARLPIASWNYITEGAHVRHLGPVSQDFRAAFGLGANDKSIAVVDADGVALAAIQGLNAKVEEQQRAIEAQAVEIGRQTTRIADLERDRYEQLARIDAMEKQFAQVAQLQDRTEQRKVATGE